MGAEGTTGELRGAAGERRLGRYALLGTLGRGGMGDVVRARAFAAGGATKELCLKRIHAERLARPGALERFVEEAKLSLRLTHANIVPVFDFGRAGDEHYLAMEWVDGADLRSILVDAAARHEPLPPAVAAHVAAEIARALAYAHGLGIVHCDVKPGNVLVARTGDVKLTDFGVATAIEGARGGGTHGYVPPEQGAHAKVAPESDVWALGIVLAEMLLGALPEDRRHVAARAPEAIAPLLARMLDDEPARRPSDASAVARELEAFVARERAAQGIAPRDELAGRASRLADARHENRAEGTLEATASWARDGASAFTEPTVQTASTRPSDPPPGRAGTAIAIAALAAAAVIAGVPALVSLRSRGDGEHGAPATPSVATAPPARANGASASEGTGLPAGAEARAPARVEAAAELDGAPTTASTAVATRSARHAREPDARRPSRGAERPDRESQAETSSAESASSPIELPAAEPAHLRINAVPWADVELDGRSLGSTPLLDVEIEPGRHTLRFSNPPLGIERFREIDVAPGDRRDLVVELE